FQLCPLRLRPLREGPTSSLDHATNGWRRQSPSSEINLLQSELVDEARSDERRCPPSVLLLLGLRASPRVVDVDPGRLPNRLRNMMEEVGCGDWPRAGRFAEVAPTPDPSGTVRAGPAASMAVVASLMLDLNRLRLKHE